MVKLTHKGTCITLWLDDERIGWLDRSFTDCGWTYHIFQDDVCYCKTYRTRKKCLRMAVAKARELFEIVFDEIIGA